MPFVAKATGVPLVEHGCRLLLSGHLGDVDLPERATPSRAWAKEAIFAEDRFADATKRGPEMRSTGEQAARTQRPRGGRDDVTHLIHRCA